MASTQPGSIYGLTNGNELMEKNRASEGDRLMRREPRASSRVAGEGLTKGTSWLRLKKVGEGGRKIPGA